MTIFGDFVRMVFTNLAAYEYHGLSFEGIIDCSRYSSTPAVSCYDDDYDLVSKGLYSSLPLPGWFVFSMKTRIPSGEIAIFFSYLDR